LKTVNPKLLIALAAVVALALVLKLLNPHKKYSTRQFWEGATVSTVASVPDKALKPGNKNGSVLMWAAMGAKDPAILRALVERGADVNESDVVFGGTPVSAAAGKSNMPEMIAALVGLGADVNKRVIEALKVAGADFSARNHQGKTALDLAREHQNATVEKALLAL
jgi:ankyrin repeat protein